MIERLFLIWAKVDRHVLCMRGGASIFNPTIFVFKFIYLITQDKVKKVLDNHASHLLPTIIMEES